MADESNVHDMGIFSKTEGERKGQVTRADVQKVLSRTDMHHEIVLCFIDGSNQTILKKDIKQLTDKAILLNDDVDFEYDELSEVHVFGE